MNSEKEKIIKSSQGLFLKKGFAKTSMDDIAQTMQMSKKTIYKYFSSKDILLKQTVITFMEFNNQQMQIIINSNENAVVKAYKLFNFIGHIILKVSNQFLFDLKNYNQELWLEIDKLRVKYLKKNLKKIIEQGKSEGYFIDESSFIIINSFISTIRGIVNPEIILIKNISVERAFKVSIKILMNGILTSKGKRVFKSLNIGANK